MAKTTTAIVIDSEENARKAETEYYLKAKLVVELSEKLKAEKKNLELLGKALTPYLNLCDNGEGTLLKVVKQPVPFDKAEWWKKHDSKLHALCSLPETINKFSLDILKKKYPDEYNEATKLTEDVIVVKDVADKTEPQPKKSEDSKPAEPAAAPAPAKEEAAKPKRKKYNFDED